MRNTSFNYFIGILLAVLSSALFGLLPLFSIPILNDGMGINSLCFYRVLFSLVVLSIAFCITRLVPSWRSKWSLKISRKEFFTLFCLTTLHSTTNVLLTLSYKLIDSGIATTIHFLYPIAVAIIMVVFFKERLTRAVVIGSTLALCGVFMLSEGGDGHIEIRGVLTVLVTVITYSCYIIGINKTGLGSLSSLTMTFYVFLCSSFFLYTNILVQDGGVVNAIPNANSFILLMLSAIFPAIMSNMALIVAVRKIGSTTTAILGCMEPLTAVAVGIAFFGESLRIIQIFGAIAIIAAVTTVILKNKKS